MSDGESSCYIMIFLLTLIIVLSGNTSVKPVTFNLFSIYDAYILLQSNDNRVRW